MFFTQEDYRKIYDWIKTHSIKDSEFSDSKPLDGMETITVVQQGHNVKFILQDFLEQLALLNIPDFVNVTERYDLKYISLFEATKAIPYRSRKIGQVITFLDEDGNWKIYQFRGEKRNQWNILTLWVDILGEIIDKGSIIPDEEDLTAVKEGDKTVVKFKDKAYNPDNFSGKGRVYLRKNITQVQDPTTFATKTVNLLTQSMIGKENTIYIIQYDYDLNGQTITIPEGCILQFEGGSFNNGTLSIQEGTINKAFHSFKRDLILKDINENIYQYWFDYEDDLSAILSNIQIDESIIVTFNITKDTVIKETIILDAVHLSINGNNHTLSSSTCDILYIRGGGLKNGGKNKVYDLIIDGVDKSHVGINIDNEVGRSITHSQKVSNVKITNCYTGIQLVNNVWAMNFENCFIYCNYIGVSSPESNINSGENIRFTDCNISNNDTAFKSYINYTFYLKGCSLDYNKCDIDGGKSSFFLGECFIEKSLNNINGASGNEGFDYICKGEVVVNIINSQLFINGGQDDVSDALFDVDYPGNFIIVGLHLFCAYKFNYLNKGSGYTSIRSMRLLGTALGPRRISLHSHNYAVDTIADLYNNIDYSLTSDTLTIWNGDNASFQTSGTGTLVWYNKIPSNGMCCFSILNIDDDMEAGMYYVSLELGYINGNGKFTKDDSYKVVTPWTNKEIVLKRNQFDGVCFPVYSSKVTCIKITFEKNESKTRTFQFIIQGEGCSADAPRNISKDVDQIVYNTPLGNVIESTTNRMLRVIGRGTAVDCLGNWYERKGYSLPNNYLNIGNIFRFDKFGKDLVIWDGDKWVDLFSGATVTQNSFPYKSGTFANKPTEVDVGYAYFCTDKQTTEGTTNGIMIYHKGDNVWVDALGRVVS